MICLFLTLFYNIKKRLFVTFGLVERFRILISNREAFSFLCIGVVMCLLFGVTLTVLTLKQGVTAGHIYAVITYLWTFAISLDDAPRLVEE
ncbi:ABC transporter six-transmembrane domain-containing protein, partial [Glaesserella parasuis]